MCSKNLANLFQSVLPAEFAEVREQLPRIQQFFEANLPEGVNQCVTVLKIDQQQIVIAATSPMVANYLRLHGSEIQQQLRETFGLERQLKFCTLPESMLKPERRYVPVKPDRVTPDSVDSITRSAQWIEDEQLRAALLSLAQSLKSPD